MTKKKQKEKKRETEIVVADRIPGQQIRMRLFYPSFFQRLRTSF